MKSLHQFETFLMVAELNSFTAAAKKLGISKAAVSHSIRLLEQSLKAPLFIRTTRHIALSEEGQQLFDQCKKLKYELDIARDIVDGFNSKPRGVLRICVNPFFAQAQLADILSAYRSLCPDVAIELSTAERMPDMASEKIDIVLGVTWPAPLDVVARQIASTRYVLCASPAYLKQYGTPKTPKELSKHMYIAHMNRSHENLIVDLKTQTPTLNIPIKLDDAAFMRLCALNHLGIVELHDYMVKKELEQGALIEVLSNYIKPEKPLYIYYQKHRYVQPKIRQFVELVMSAIQTQQLV